MTKEEIFEAVKDIIRTIAPDELEVAALVWARSLLVTEAALSLVLTRAGAAAEDVAGWASIPTRACPRRASSRLPVLAACFPCS